MKKGLGLLFQAIMVILFLSIAITLIVPRFTQPTIVAHGTKQAEIVAERLADAINAMSSMEEGFIEHNINGPWNIEVYSKKGAMHVRVSYDVYSAESEIIGNVDSADLSGVEIVKITKESGEKVKVEKL